WPLSARTKRSGSQPESPCGTKRSRARGGREVAETGLNIFVVSDGTGETADQLVKEALVQDARDGIKIRRYKNIRTESDVLPIVEEAGGSRSLIVFTVVSDALRAFLSEKATQAGVPSIDLLGPIMSLFTRFLIKDPDSRPGLFHQVND